jgi:cellulose biosynthesis protein BcsQ
MRVVMVAKQKGGVGATTLAAGTTRQIPAL